MATEQAKVLLGSYPREPHDPVTFTAAIVQVLSEYPEDAGREAVDRLTRRLKHYPTRADLVEALEEVMSARRAAHAQARAVAQDRQRAAEERQREQVRKAEREQLMATLGDAWNDWWSIPVIRRYTGTPEQFAAGWKKAADREAFTASWGHSETEGRA